MEFSGSERYENWNSILTHEEMAEILIFTYFKTYSNTTIKWRPKSAAKRTGNLIMSDGNEYI